MTRFGESIKLARDHRLKQGDRKYSVRQLAMRMGIEPSFLSKLERGLAQPSEKTARLLARELDLNADNLMAQGGRLSASTQRLLEKRPDEVTALLTKLKLVHPEDFDEFYSELVLALLDWVQPESEDEQFKIQQLEPSAKSLPSNSPVPPINPNKTKPALWGKELATTILIDLGYSVIDHPDFPTNSNALFVEGPSAILGKKVCFTVFPKTSRISRQIRLGSAEFVSKRGDHEFYFAFMPSIKGKPVFNEFDIFVVPATLARNDGLFVNEVYEARGGKSAGIILKDIQREPHKSIMARWNRCFLVPRSFDWLPR
jgi:HTH-type transcriptional regulator, competence development regulator